tara:strand:- start:2896 stop:3861 length:966 start_codon:yes stop_codon:yes gene_type:complete
MGTYYNNSGSAAGAVSGSLTRLISEFEPMIRASRIGHLLGARVPNQKASTKVSMQYFLRNTFVDGSGLNTGERLIGQLVPTAEPGQWKTADAMLVDLGSEVRIDSADGYTVDSMGEMDEAGTMQTFDRCLDYIDMKASDLLADTDTPWATDDQASAAWTTAGTDIKKEISDALQAVETEVGERLPEGRLAMVVGSKTYEGMKYNESWTTLWGGASSLGSLDHGQLVASLKSIGISELYVGLDARYGEFANIFVKPPEGASIATPAGRVLMGAGLVMPHAGADLFEVFSPREIDQRNYGYLCVANTDLVALPEFGVRISGTS